MKTAGMTAGTKQNRLDSFFSPNGIAVIGASQAEGRPGRVVIENLKTNGFAGYIYPVNPRGGEILGHKVYPSVAEIPAMVDFAVCMLPANATAQAVRDCAAKGIKSVVLAAGGFAEIDAGEDLQAELAAVVQDTGIRILGPNTAGHISTPANFTSSFFPLGKIPAGPISYIAQTGNFTGAMMRHIMTAENYGVARCIGLGNAVDIDEADVLEYLAGDDHTGIVFAYLEDLKHPTRFLDIAAKMTRRKPLIVLKGGATAEGAKAAQSHTASLGVDDRVLDGAFRQAGIVRIHEFSQLFTVAKAAAFMPPPAGHRVGFVSPSGAFIVHINDLCRQRLGLRFPKFEPATLSRLREISPPIVNISNPVDVFPSVTVHGLEFAYRESMEAALADKNVDAVVTILILVDALGVPNLDFIVDLARRYREKPIYVSFSGDDRCNAEAKAFLEPQGIPTFPRIEDPFHALDVMARCRAAMNRN